MVLPSWIADETSRTRQSPLAAIATISRVVSRVVDRLTGARVDYPLLVAAATVEALALWGIQSRVMYGQVAWVEILKDQTVIWAGCWGENYHFWVATQFGEVVDLNASVAFRKRAHSDPRLEAIHSPPMLWATEVPQFYRFQVEGVAEVDLLDETDQRRFLQVRTEVLEKCRPPYQRPEDEDLEFPNEPIVCPGRRILDDSQNSFRHFDRYLSVQGFPPLPADLQLRG